MFTGSLVVARLLIETLPRVEVELARWRRAHRQFTNLALKEQARRSLLKKRFHAQGGSVYAILSPFRLSGPLISLIVAFQTISDYLDNLCDRSGVCKEEAFRGIHAAMTDALDPLAHIRDYYASYPAKGDGGYLEGLVTACRRGVRELPSYEVVRPSVLDLVRLYSELQVRKHLDPASRERRLREWIEPNLRCYPGVEWWEYAAATGSTLGIFALCAAAASPGLHEADALALFRAYFPWIGGLHILLDYFIDRQEDRQAGDLNFTSYYPDAATCARRLRFFAEKSLRECGRLRSPSFHAAVVRGLLGLYLSDPKVRSHEWACVSREVLRTGGTPALVLHDFCCALRHFRVI